MSLKIGDKVTVQGRFVPESKLEKSELTDLTPINLSGTIAVIKENKCIIDFEEFDQWVPFEDIGVVR